MSMVFLPVFSLSEPGQKEWLVQAMYDFFLSVSENGYLQKSAEMKVQKEISLILKYLVREYI